MEKHSPKLNLNFEGNEFKSGNDFSFPYRDVYLIGPICSPRFSGVDPPCPPKSSLQYGVNHIDVDKSNQHKYTYYKVFDWKTVSDYPKGTIEIKDQKIIIHEFVSPTLETILTYNIVKLYSDKWLVEFKEHHFWFMLIYLMR